MVKGFADQGAEDIYYSRDTAKARKTLPADLLTIARRKLASLDFATTLESLRIPPSNRLEMLQGARKGQHSIRINDKYRICFVWTGSNAEQVEIVDYH